MSQQNIYPVQLLNDIHNYFPDILYNPGRFRTVHDLLDYIRSVADVNPFSRGLTNYNVRQTQNMRSNEQPRPTQSPRANSVNVTWIPNINEPHVTTEQFQIPIHGNSNIMSTLLGGLMAPIMGGIPNGLQTFLDQRVIVHPTQEEIEQASLVYNSTGQQDDICAICQDIIEQNQQVRRLLHCGHHFHLICIDTWFRENVHCPTCRHDIREVSQQHAPPPVPENHRRTNINDTTSS
jgi:hypothetical protein